MKKLIILSLLWGCGITLSIAQTDVNKSFQLSTAQKVELKFQFADVKVRYWDKNEVKVQGRISINMGENDAAYALTSSMENNTLVVKGDIPDINKLPQYIQVKEGEDLTVIKMEKGKSWDRQVKNVNGESINVGVIKEISLEVFVPKNKRTDVYTKFGMIETTDPEGNIVLNAKFGGVDVSCSASSKYNFEIDYEWGEVYTDLNLNIEKSQKFNKKKDQLIKAKMNGGGKTIFIDSKFGNVYLRKKK